MPPDPNPKASERKYCKMCNKSINKRSRYCRTCNQQKIMEKRYPVEKRALRKCQECGARISYQSVKGKGRCRECYFQWRKDTSKKSGYKSKLSRLTDRQNPGTGYYDASGDYHFADDQVGKNGRFTVASAWASLRLSWRGYRAAMGEDHSKMNLYAGRIQYFARILRLDVPDFGI